MEDPINYELRGIERFAGIPALPKLITLEPKGRIVFVGDTHGDLEASQKVINNYLNPNTKIVFLGDYVDRGKYSKENVEYIFEQFSSQVIPMQGNHEGFMKKQFTSDFWWPLDKSERNEYHNLFQKLPLAISVGNILAVHACPPDIEKLDDINNIELGDENWDTILWKDLKEEKGKVLYGYVRSTCGEDYFNEVMERLNKGLLIRGHDYYANQSMFDGRCLTLFTTNAYGPELKREIAIADFDKGPVENIRDLDIICLDQ